ncbi:hypothetical protein GCM10027081_25710 [Cupriavidus yeoncheonensis]
MHRGAAKLRGGLFPSAPGILEPGAHLHPIAPCPMTVRKGRPRRSTSMVLSRETSHELSVAGRPAASGRVPAAACLMAR